METKYLLKKQTVCFRCGVFFKNKNNLKLHLKKKKECPMYYLDLERDEIIEDYFSYILQFIDDYNNKNVAYKIGKKNLQCEYCYNTYTHKTTYYAHKRTDCKSPYNPINMIATQVNITN